MKMSYITPLFITRYLVTENKELKYAVIDVSYYINLIIKNVYSEQQKIFGRSIREETQQNKMIYLNNFFVCLDTTFRFLSHTRHLMNKLKEDYNTKKFYFVIPQQLTLPRWYRVFGPKGFHDFQLSKEDAYRETARYLEQLAPYLTDEEIEEYIPFEKFIAKEYPTIFYRTLHSRNVIYEYSRETRNSKKNLFYCMMQILQSQPTENEWKYIIDFYLHSLRKIKGVRVLQENSAFIDNYGAAELAVHLGQSIIISDHVVCNTNVYAYHPIKHMLVSTKKRKHNLLNAPDLNLYQYKMGTHFTLSEMFDFCQNEMEDKMLSIDMYNSYNIFNNPKVLYEKNKKPKAYESFEFSYTDIPLDKGMCVEILKDFVPKYNELYDLKIRIE